MIHPRLHVFRTDFTAALALWDAGEREHATLKQDATVKVVEQ